MSISLNKDHLPNPNGPLNSNGKMAFLAGVSTNVVIRVALEASNKRIKKN